MSAMLLGGLVFYRRDPRCTATWRTENALGWPWLVLLATFAVAFSVVAAALVPVQAAQLEETALPWSALPQSEPAPHPLRLLVVPGSPIAIGFDPNLQWSETPAPAISTTLWSSEYGDVLFGVSVDEYPEGDSLFGDARKDFRKTYKAILAFDQPLGFSTALSMDVLSKDKRRGLGQFQLLQIGVSHPVADGGRITVGCAIFLNGNNPMNAMNPEQSLGIRLFLPFDWP